jgi:hypothetical protein
VFIPDADFTLPPVPDLHAITVPTPDEISLPEWDEVAPEAYIPDPGGEFVWFEPGYFSAMLDEVKSRLSTMLAGGTGIPDAIWNMIWDRARAALYEQRDAAIEEATERWAARGFSVPGGALNKQIERAIRAFNNASAEQLRETAIKQAEMEVQNLQFAVQQGIALESQLMDLYNQQIGRILDAAKTKFQIAIDLYQARVQRYNIEAQVYSAKAQVHKTLIEAELSKLEEYKARLEGEKLIGELNMQDVQIYTAQVDAVGKEVEVFKAQLDGVKAQVDVDKTRVEAYAAGVQAYGEMVKAKAIEYEAYNAEIKGEQVKAEIYKALADAYGSEVDAYGKKVQAEVMAAEIDIKDQQLAIDLYKTSLARFEAELKYETDNADTTLKKTATAIEELKAVLADKGLSLEYEKLVAGFKMEAIKDATQKNIAKLNADVEIEKADTAAYIEGKKTEAMIKAQLAASALSAINISAGVSYSGSDSNSSDCSKTYQYDGDGG